MSVMFDVDQLIWNIWLHINTYIAVHIFNSLKSKFIKTISKEI